MIFPKPTTDWNALTDNAFRERAAAFFDSMATPDGRARAAREPWATVREQFVLGMCGFRSYSGEARPKPCDVSPIADLHIPVMALIGRYEWGDFDLAGVDDLSLLTVGANRFFARHQVKLSADVGYSFNALNMVGVGGNSFGWASPAAGWRPGG